MSPRCWWVVGIALLFLAGSAAHGGDGTTTDMRAHREIRKAELGIAIVLFRQGKYAVAEPVFRRIAEDDWIPSKLVAEALYYQAECLRRQKYYPAAADAYLRLNALFPESPHLRDVTRKLFDIADYWLDDTREEMRQDREYRAGKRLFVWPHLLSCIHLDRTKPFVDEEGRALEVLYHVQYSDLKGPLADKAAFLSGCVELYREDYDLADDNFSSIVACYPDSPYMLRSLEYAIWAKHMTFNDAKDKDRQAAEIRKLIDTAEKYPELKARRREYLLKMRRLIERYEEEKKAKSE